ncbi:hypothetical protein BH09BAC1_BH09BAC1_13980 [soil metagenome]
MDFIQRIPYSENLKDTIAEVINKSRVTVIIEVPDIDISQYYVELGEAVGMLFRKDVDPINKKIIDNSWTTVKFDPRYIEQTYKHSNKHQPLHTDYCNASINLDVVLLICESAAVHGGATVFLDGALLVELLKTYRPELFEKLQHHEVIFGRQPSPIFRNTVKVISFDQHGPIVNWNYAVVAPDNTPEVLAMAEELHDFLENYVMFAGIPEPVYLKKGEAVFMHDQRLLHGRNAFLGDRSLLKGGIATTDAEAIKAKLKQLNF